MPSRVVIRFTILYGKTKAFHRSNTVVREIRHKVDEKLVLKYAELNSGILRTNALGLASVEMSCFLRCKVTPLLKLPVLDVSYNQPKFCPSATWNSTGIIVANHSQIDFGPYGLFINTNNTIYVSSPNQGKMYMKLEGSTDIVSMNISGYYDGPYSQFVDTFGDIYHDIGAPFYQVRAWRTSTSSHVLMLSTGGQCNNIFIDTNDSLYCSMQFNHRVTKRSLGFSDNQTIIVAGGDCGGFLPNRLYNPSGIFVAINSDLYVADTGNHRIQIFHPGQANGTTVVGREAFGTITLRRPTSVVLDADEYLFIVDCFQHRVVRSTSDGFFCVVGCSEVEGSASDQLSRPQIMAFGRNGDIFILDRGNSRLQKFLLASNSCSK